MNNLLCGNLNECPAHRHTHHFFFRCIYVAVCFLSGCCLGVSAPSLLAWKAQRSTRKTTWCCTRKRDGWRGRSGSSARPPSRCKRSKRRRKQKLEKLKLTLPRRTYDSWCIVYFEQKIPFIITPDRGFLVRDRHTHSLFGSLLPQQQ